MSTTGDDRSISIDRGDVVGSTVITGNGNIVVLQAAGMVREQPQDRRQADAKIGLNPYKGLLAFYEADADRFFGREDQTDRLWQLLRKLHDPPPHGQSPLRLLPVLGPSGSGKSSVARAGLIPELARRPLPGWNKARVAVLTPGSHPLEALAAVLARIATGDTAPVQKTREFVEELNLRTNEGQCDGLRRIAVSLPEIASTPLIVLVDQFEEIYSLCTDADERTTFVDNLLCGVTDPAANVSAIITLRTDFLDETQNHPQLNSAIADLGAIIPAMNEDELRRAITEPAKLAGRPLDEATVDLLINETEGREGALPMLQFALTRIWDGLIDGVAPADTLKKIGGVGGALAGEAQRIYDNLPDVERNIARRVFLGLVQLGEGTRDTRRRVVVASLVAVGEDPDQVEEVVRRFSAPGVRLITLSAKSDGTETAEVTHEALFECWRQLDEWLASSRDDLRFQRRLDQAARHWNSQDRAEGLLWRPPDLDLMRAFHQRAGGDMTRQQLDFFVASEQFERRRIEEKQLQQTRLSRYLKISITTAVVAVILAGLSSVLFFAAQKARDRAELQTRIASAQRLAAESQVVRIQTDPQSLPQRAVLLAAEAVKTTWDDKIRVTASEQALRDAVGNCSGFGLGGHKGIVHDVKISPDSRWAVTVANNAKLWDLAASLPSDPGVDLMEHVTCAAISADSRWVATGSQDKEVRLWDLQAADPAARSIVLEGHQNRVESVVFSHENRWLASAGWDRTVRLWDMTAANPANKAFSLRGHEHIVKGMAISPDDRWLVSVSVGNARLWDLTAADPATTGIVLRGHKNHIKAFDFSPDGHWLVTGSQDKKARLWDLTADDPAKSGKLLAEHEDSVNGVAFSPDNRWLITGGWHQEFTSEGKIRLWSLEAEERFSTPIVLGQSEGVVHGFAISQDGRWLVTGGRDSIVRVWNLMAPSAEPIPLPGHAGTIKAAAISSDSRWLLTGASDDTVRRWDLAAEDPVSTVTVFRGHEMTPGIVAISPDDRWVVTASGPRFFGPSMIETSARLHRLDGHGPNVLEGHTAPVGGVAVSSDSRWLVTGGGTSDWAAGDETPRLWDLRSPNPALMPIQLHGHEEPVTDVAIGPDDHWIATASYDKTVRLWDLKSSDVAKSAVVLQGHTGKSLAIAISPDSQWLASAGADKTPRLWRLTSADPSQRSIELQGHDGSVDVVAISGDSRWLATGGTSEKMRLWDLTASSPEQRSIELAGQDFGVGAVTFCPDGKWLVAATLTEDGIPGNAVIWGVNDSEPSSWTSVTLPDHQPNIVAFSPDGRKLVTTKYDEVMGTADTTIQVWDLTPTGPSKTSIVLRGPAKDIRAIAVSSDSRWLLAGSMDGRAYLWDLSAAQLAASSPIVLRGHRDHVLSVAITPDQQWLITGSTDRTARLWPLRLDDLLEQARRTVGRNFTADEWSQYFPGEEYRKTFDSLPGAD